MYWLGWFPVAPLNMILASFYIADLFGLDTTSGFTPIDTPIAWWTLIISVVGILLFFIPAYLGIRVGARFATVLGVLAMIPLTFLAVVWLFTGDADWGQLSGFHQLDGTGFFTGLDGTGWFALYMGYAFLLTWNVLAMEAAACYIGETRDPDKDAKIAMNLEGLYGLAIYTLIPMAFVCVLGAKALSNPDLVDPNTIFVTFAGQLFNAGGELLNWLIAGMLIVALMLSALNAIMGCARSLHQMSVDGQFPRFFQRTNRHGVPANAMVFNVIFSLLVVLLGGAVQIYSFSNVGYTGSLILVLIAYYLLRRYRPQRPAARAAARAVQVRRARRRLLPVRLLAVRRDLLRPHRRTPRSTTSSAGRRRRSTSRCTSTGRAWRTRSTARSRPRRRCRRWPHRRTDAADRRSRAGAPAPRRCIRGPSCWPPRSASIAPEASTMAARLAAPVRRACLRVRDRARPRHQPRLPEPGAAAHAGRSGRRSARASTKAVKALRRRGVRSGGPRASARARRPRRSSRRRSASAATPS